MPTYSDALNWNREHPIGSPVIVTLADGRTVEDRTTCAAIQWGSVAMLTLQGRPGMWVTTMLAAVPASVE
jgi:hypothetical protein